MNKKTMRIMCLILAAVLVLACVPALTFAAEEQQAPEAEVAVLEPKTLKAGEYQVWNGSLSEGKTDLPLQVVMNFKAKDTVEQAIAKGYADWLCDFNLEVTGLKNGSITANNCYLAGYYGDFGWIAIPTDGLEIEEGVSYPVVANYDATLNYKDICGSVQDFTAAIYIAPEILAANPDFKIALSLKMTDSEDASNTLTIGQPAVYDVAELTKPRAEVTQMAPVSLKADEYKVYDGSLTEGTKDLYLPVVMNFKALETFEQAKNGYYAKWICDFYLTFEGLEEGYVEGAGSYLVGNYGNFGWIAVDATGVKIEEGVSYPVVTNFDPNLTYENICDYVKDFTAALYVAPETLEANPNMKVTLSLDVKDPENEENVLTVGEPAVYDVPALMGMPKAKVEVLEPVTLKANEYKVYDGSLYEGTEDLPLQVVMSFEALETYEQAQNSPYAKWICDFFLEFEGLATGSFEADGCYLAGNYGEFGWIAIPTDDVVLEEGVSYPVVSQYDDNLTYENICDYVKNFTAAVHVDPAVLTANPDFKINLSLKVKDPANDENVFTIGETASYTAEDLMPNLPKAEVSVLDPITLTPEEHDYMVWPSGDDTVERPLQIVMNFKAQETLEEALANGYADWLCDFNLKITGLEEGSVIADGCYLAGNYGSFGWIVIPTDGLEIEEGISYPVVANYDATLNYKDICSSVKDFTAAIYITPEILNANPNIQVELSLVMTDPEDADNQLTIGETATYTVEDLMTLPKATVEVQDAVTLPAGGYDIWNGSLTEGTEDLPLQIVMNFKAEDTLEEAKLGGYGKWLCDFNLKITGLEEDSVTADGCYLAGNYGDFGWIAIPTDGMVIEEGVSYPVVANYDASLNYEDICGSVQDFTAAIYIAPEILEANPDMQVELSLVLTHPEDEDVKLAVGDAAIYNVVQLMGYVAQNTKTGAYYHTVEEGLAAAEDGQTVILLKKASAGSAFIQAGTTLDLNGFALEAKYMAAFGQLIDSSEANTGLLNTKKDHFMIREDNTYLPVTTDAGYRFFALSRFPEAMRGVSSDAAAKEYCFLPFFDVDSHELIAAGSETSGVTVGVQLTWNTEDGVRTQKFVYNDAMVAELIAGYGYIAEKNNYNYKDMFTLVINNYANYEGLTCDAFVASDAGVALYAIG